MSREYTHWACFRRVWQMTVGEGWQAAAEEHYCIEPGALEEVVNVPAEEDLVLKLQSHLLAELDAHRARLRSLLEQTDVMQSEIISKMDDAATAARSRDLVGGRDDIVASILMEGEFV